MSDHNRRCEDWPEKLNDVIKAYFDRHYVWGESDCGTFACDVVKALIGVDLYEEFRGAYNSERQYKKLLIANNCNSISELFEIVASEHGIYEIGKKFAFRGDIVCMTVNKIESLGVYVGPCAMFHVEHGLISVSMDDCRLCWAVR